MQLLQGSTHYFGQPEKYIALLDQLIDELTVAARTPEDRYFIPFVLAGGAGGLGIPVITLKTNMHKERPTEKQIMRVKTFVEMLS